MSDMGQTAVVTGASTGIGRALAIELAKTGYSLILVARSREGLSETAKLTKAAGAQTVIVPTDLRVEKQVDALAATILDQCKELDLLANVAGVWHDDSHVFYGPRLHETPATEIRDVLEVGTLAPILLTRALLPAMIKRHRGQVINISGTFSAGGSGWLHYYVSKKALEQFTVALADEVRSLGVRVNCISPADVATEAYIRYFPDEAAGALTPEEVSKATLLLLSADAKDISGQIIEVRSSQVDGARDGDD
jgi:NAD(P)-dependent dehydrogenase (short-subunit alcohol dehydrogenase family)